MMVVLILYENTHMSTWERKQNSGFPGNKNHFLWNIYSMTISYVFSLQDGQVQLFYKVKWVKYTWEAEESIQHLPHLIDGYWREHFYQNINQAAIDTSTLTLVNENDFNRGKTIIVQQDEAQKVSVVFSTICQRFSRAVYIFS